VFVVIVAVKVIGEPKTGSNGVMVGADIDVVAFETESVKVAFPEVPVAVAVSVYVVRTEVTVGVPVIVPLALRIRPAGSVGEIV
jgi:hypothetical protein